MAFKKVQRSYHSTPNGWRLATFKEAEDGLKTIKNQNLLNKWDRVRLLDGWITGPGYNYEMGESFKGCLGYMLLIQAEATGGAYANVILSDRGKEVALFLCVDDWNYEVVYWLLNCWSNCEIMNVGDVTGGNIPFNNVEKFEEMNNMIGYVARRLGGEGGAALEKAGKMKYSGKDSVKEVLSGMIKIVKEEKDIVQFIGSSMWHFTSYEGDEYCLPESVKTEDVAEPFWSFVCDSFAGYVVEVCASRKLLDISKMETNSTSKNNLTIATSILLCLSDFRTDIIHEPMAHNCKDSCAEKILRHAAEKAKAAGDPHQFNEMLKNNAMWKCYDETGNYGVLDKLLIIIAKHKFYDGGEIEKKAIVDMLLQVGAQPGRCNAIGKYKNKTVLHSVAKFRDEGVGKEIAEALLCRCDEQSILEFVNAADERGWTALHSASKKGNARICGLLVDHGALVTAQDQEGMTALHYAFEGEIGKNTDVGTEIAQALLLRCDEQIIYECVNLADKRGRTALHGASKKGNARICKLLVDRGALVTARDKNGMTALHYAFEEGTNKGIDVEIEIAQALLRRCDEQSIYEFVNATDDRGRTILHLASKKGNTYICELLLCRGALVSAKDKKGMTALQYVFKGGIDKVIGSGTEIAQALLHRCDEQSIYEFVNAADERGRTALHRASKKGNARICGLLVDRGALVTARDRKDMTSLHYAFEGGIDKVIGLGTEIAQVLLCKCNEQSKHEFVNAVDERGRTALHRASETGNARICGLLVDHGASVTARDKKNMTTLHYVFEGGIDKDMGVGTEIAQVLLDKCDEQRKYDFVNATDEKGRAALHVASEKGNTSMCRLLLDCGAVVSAKDKRDMTALHYAFKGGIDKVIGVGTEIAQALLDRCDQLNLCEFVNAADERGKTALHRASKKGNTDICKLLLDHGASVIARDKKDMTALHYAFEEEIDKVKDAGTEIAKALLHWCDKRRIYEFVNAADERGRIALHGASEKGNARICEMLLDRGSLVTAKDKDGMTALHYAFKGGIDKVIGVETKIAQALLRRCHKESIYEFVNAADRRGKTALHKASKKGNAHICRLLVHHGASVTAKNEKGMTALHYAFKEEIYKVIDVGMEIAEALLRKCDEQSIYEFVTAADERGRTALHNASEKGNARICELLVGHGALVTTQDKRGMTALHYALEGGIDKGGIDKVIDVLVKSLHITESVDLKDKRGRTPLDIALANMDYKSTAKLLLKSRKPEAYMDRALPNMDYESTAKLLSKSKKPEDYFNKVVDQGQLLRYSLRLGSVYIVNKLFRKGIKLPAGDCDCDCDEDGKTALHLAAMCDNESNAIEIISLKISGETQVDLENMVAKRDKRGRTVLHEAALNGYEDLCLGLLQLNSELIYIKDRDGRNPLYDAAKGQYKGTALYKRLLKAYLEKDKPEDDLMDRSGLTPLHVAASQGKAQLVKELLSIDKIKTKYLSRGDILAQTALHKAVKRGDKDTVRILLKHGAHPLRERDCDGRTALHYAVQAETEHKEELARMLFKQCKSDDEKSLLSWASAAGLGTADQDLSEDDPLHRFLVDQKNAIQERNAIQEEKAIQEKTEIRTDNLLQMAASIGDIEMTKELISRGYQIGDIRDPKWKTALTKANKKNVENVLRQIEMIKEQGNDRPAISDSLGRMDYAKGLAALFLNPYIKPPIAVGITGSWGMGKSSLMVQTERILLTTAAQMALRQSSKLSSSELPGIKPCKLSKKGKRKLEHIYRHIKWAERVNRYKFVILWDYIKSKLKQTRVEKIQEKLEKFLNEYDLKYLKVFKALAAMDSSDMLKTNASPPKADSSAEENVPAVLTVQYNAWKYRSDTEALAGIAVDITKELEGTMTQAQWFNTCWRNTWKKKKYTLWIEIFFPSLLALVLVGSFTWIGWVLLDSDKLKEWGKAKYAWPPAAGVVIVWTLTKSIMSILKPVSTQLMQYISFPDHTDKLGYQERVISDISFLKDEIGKKAHWVFIVFAWVLTTFTVLWSLITESCITSLLFHHRSHEKSIEAPKVAPASRSNLRIIVFVDDLDRCAESVILQVLSAVNLVLAVCEISVVIGMDKRLIERAIIKKYKDANANKSLQANQEMADMYLQKIIQLPLDLPDPSGEESKRFLKEQLGVLENENKAFIKNDRSSSSDDGEREDVPQNTLEINVHSTSEITEAGPAKLPEPIEHTETDGEATSTSKEKLGSFILVREVLFVRYSKGEEDAFLYFQGLATDCRKHPREWKRLLNYHRLVWCILSVSKEAKKLVGWQVELITWIFICWEWQECMNLVIEKWKEIGDHKTNVSSLLTIVEHLMNTKATSYENSKKASSEKLTSSMEKKLNALEKSLAELKKEIKELKVSDELKKDMKEFEKHLSDELKKDMKEVKEQIESGKNEDTKEVKEQVESGKSEDLKEIKEQIVKKGSKKNEEKWNENWERMKSTLEKYDVSMDGIQAFQRFRFYCIAGYLPPC